MPEPWCFLASSWAQAWAESHLPRERWRPPCRYLMVRDRTGAVTGVAPLATMQFGPIRFCAGGGYFLPYRSLALDAMAMDASCDAIVGALAGYVRFRAGFRLGPLASIDPMSGALAAALRRHGWWVGTRILGASFIVALPQSLTEFEAACHGAIKRAAYHERRLRRTGNLEIRRYNDLAAAEWSSVVADAALIENNSWVAKQNETLHFTTAETQKFWKLIFVDPYLSSIISIYILYLDGRPITFSLNIDTGRTKYILANLYDDRFKTHSCGTVLANHVLRDAIEAGQTTVDWGQGDSGYKRQWSAAPRHAVCDMIAFPPGPIGRLAAALLDGRSGYSFRSARRAQSPSCASASLPLTSPAIGS